jgi:hypothetical protein
MDWITKRTEKMLAYTERKRDEARAEVAKIRSERQQVLREIAAERKELKHAKDLQVILDDLNVAERQLRYSRRAMLASAVAAVAAIISAAAAVTAIVLTASR